MKKPLTPVQFFKKHAGYYYRPESETKAQGRARCAKQLAKAEAYARDVGISFSWEVDPYCDICEFSSSRPYWPLWYCVAHSALGNTLASLGGIDFGRKGTPWSDPYRRVVEAELALDVMLSDAPC